VRVEAGRLERWVAGFGDRHDGAEMSWDAEGLTLLGGDGTRARLALPYPPWPGGSVADSVTHLLAPRRTLVLIVRRGGYACAVVDATAEGLRLTASTVASRHVQGRTAAGGWSQQRFARRRQKQAAELVHAVAEHAVRILLPLPAGGRQAATPSCWLATGGDRPLVAEVLADPRLRAVRDLPLAAQLAVGDPDRRSVEGLPGLLTTVTITITENRQGARSPGERADG